MHNHTLKRLTSLLFARTVFFVSFQLLVALLLSWNEAIPWWPLSMIATNAVCLVILIMLLRKEKKAFSSIQLMPFGSFLPLGKAAEFLNGRFTQNRLMNVILDIVLFVMLLAFLGVPAIALNEFLNESIPVLRVTNITGMLPNWALYLMIVLLPLTQALVEFPWFYGYVYPRLEAYFEAKDGNRRMVASAKALAITLAFFGLQVVLVPPVIDPAYIMWRAISFVPLLLVIGITVRLAPRFMPGINAMHALMAVKLVLDYWRLK